MMMNSGSSRPDRLRPKVLFIGGSLNQTKMMLAVAEAMPEADAYFTYYYGDGIVDLVRRLGLLEWTVLGTAWRQDSIELLHARGKRMDPQGRSGGWDLVVTSSDLIVPKNIRATRIALVQEGMTDPEGLGFLLRRWIPFLPVWIAGTAGTGTSRIYDRFCVASEGYRDLFVEKGAPPERTVVTGIPNFDDCVAYARNNFPHRDYVLVCTSDTRETFKRDDRRAFIRKSVALAAGRQLIFKLHPNEDFVRNSREIEEEASGALIYTTGSAEQMVANCSVLIVQYSTLAYVGLALDKEVHAFEDVELLRRLVPLQGGRAAESIARVCSELLLQPVEELIAARTAGQPDLTPMEALR